MSEPDKRKRRQFLADALFAGGGLAAAALLARGFMKPGEAVAQGTPTPSASPSAKPSCPPTPNMPVPGEMVAEPQIEGKVAPAAPTSTPNPAIRGDVK